MRTAADVLGISPVIPVVALDDAANAIPLGQALSRGGIRTIEVTLRTREALPAIERLTAELPEIVVGAGTITEPGQAEQASNAGARYLVTPGYTERILDEIGGTGLPCLPGAGTVSEAMLLAERGYSVQKFFPAQPSGGVAYLNAIAGPLPNLLFCPTGGITQHNASSYLAQPNVGCVGGSWLTPKSAIASGDWNQIETLARQAAELS